MQKSFQSASASSLPLLCRRISLLLALLLVQACATTNQTDVNDPYEEINRKIFAFNDSLDRNFLLPVSRGYRFLMPAFAEQGVRNFFSNLEDFNSAINALMQGKLDGATRNGGRFLLNSTGGLLGFVDIATVMGVDSYRTDFGHTLAIWGVNPGPYLMVPAFGPRTLRSGTGYIFDTLVSAQSAIDSLPARVALSGLELVEDRADLVEAEGLIFGDRYIFIRDVYLQHREALMSGGEVEDSFSDYDEDFDWDE
ncbi:MAG: VacJ family lipoprotein [Halieaceae bacterium]|nr:VacJ family lipoprotein [Halieaceae bacterium]